MNNYFNDTPLLPFSKAREDRVNAQFSAISTAFGKLPEPDALASITGYLTVGGTGNALTVTHPFEDFAYTAGTELSVRIVSTSTGPVTINVTPVGGDALGAVAIRHPDGTALAAGQLRPGAIVKMAFDGTVFRVIGGLWSEPVLAGALADLAAAMLTANVLPTQTGNAGKVITTDGTTPSWTTYFQLPDPSTNAGKTLVSDGTAWQDVERYPTLSAGKFLTNDGADVMWGDVANVQTFTASGTWTKPTGARLVMVEIYGGGGGGASGSYSAGTIDTVTGGGGGGGGSFQRLTFTATDLPGTVAVTIGAGGAGGAARVSNAVGATGANGGTSSFGVFAFGYGGDGAALVHGEGYGGSGADDIGYPNPTARPSAGYAANSGPSDPFQHGIGGGGGAGGKAAGVASISPGIAPLGGAGGGQGGHAVGVTNTAAGGGGYALTLAGGARGVLGATAGGAGGFRQGGGGGVNGGAGGAGGLVGGGGGGGPGTSAGGGYPSGAGGAGGGGYCRVTTW